MSSTQTGRDWDAATYDRISHPQQDWAREQLARLELTGEEVVLDAGCGSGRVTLALLERLPTGRVYAVDAAPSMVAHAREALGERARVLCQDLAALTLPEPVDVIFSNATFHWLPDHDVLFAALARALRPGGRLIAQCGGAGNIASVDRAARATMARAPFAAHVGDWTGPWTYATDLETGERLRRAGFAEVETWLEPRPTPMPDGREFVASVCLVRHLDRLPEDLRETFVDAVMAQLSDPLVLDYVRLNMRARRSGEDPDADVARG